MRTADALLEQLLAQGDEMGPIIEELLQRQPVLDALGLPANSEASDLFASSRLVGELRKALQPGGKLHSHGSRTQEVNATRGYEKVGA